MKEKDKCLGFLQIICRSKGTQKKPVMVGCCKTVLSNQQDFEWLTSGQCNEPTNFFKFDIVSVVLA